MIKMRSLLRLLRRLLQHEARWWRPAVDIARAEQRLAAFAVIPLLAFVALSLREHRDISLVIPLVALALVIVAIEVILYR